MNINKSNNSADILGRRIKKNIIEASNDGKTSRDLGIANVRAGFQQRYGSLQMETVATSQYALFGSWSGSSATVGP